MEIPIAQLLVRIQRDGAFLIKRVGRERRQARS